MNYLLSDQECLSSVPGVLVYSLPVTFFGVCLHRDAVSLHGEWVIGDGVDFEGEVSKFRLVSFLK